jgi:hypothetical protein
VIAREARKLALAGLEEIPHRGEHSLGVAPSEWFARAPLAPPEEVVEERLLVDVLAMWIVNGQLARVGLP